LQLRTWRRVAEAPERVAMTRRQAELFGTALGVGLLIPTVVVLRYVGLPLWGWLTIIVAAILGAALIATDLMLSRRWVGAVVSILGMSLVLLMFPIERLLLTKLPESWVDTVMIGSLLISAVAILMIIGGVVMSWRRRPPAS